jgi:hypothetical protein
MTGHEDGVMPSVAAGTIAPPARGRLTHPAPAHEHAGKDHKHHDHRECSDCRGDGPCSCRHRCTCCSCCGCHPCPAGDGSGNGDEHRPPRGRPGREPGTDRGDLGTPVTPGDIHSAPPTTSWPGPRKDLYLPYLFLRANPGDTGTRPAIGAFWESPDIYLLAGVAPDAAPPIPAELGQNAIAGEPNTIYAHVWNFGHAPAHNVIVEFSWCNPSLGINPASAHLIGRAVLDLGARGSGRAHHVVKCPQPWTPTFVNGGHECLVVRVWDVVGDMLSTPEWDASVNRHVGQRNVHVVDAAGGAAAPAAAPLKIAVGPLFGEAALVKVERAHPANVPWLQLRTGARGLFPAPAAATGPLDLEFNGSTGDTHQITGDGQHVTLNAGDDPPPPGSAHVYRVTASQGGATFGGYTVVVMG